MYTRLGAVSMLVLAYAAGGTQLEQVLGSLGDAATVIVTMWALRTCRRESLAAPAAPAADTRLTRMFEFALGAGDRKQQ